jgi:hypothetical protein
MRKRIGAVIVAVLVAVAVVGLLLRGNTKDDASTSTRPYKPPATSNFTQANADMIESALASRDKEAQKKALVPTENDGSWQATKVMPADATLIIHRGTFRVNEDGYGAVNATVTQKTKQTNFVLVMVYVKGQWLIYTTAKG